MAEGVTVRLLGPVTAARDGVEIDLGSPHRQALAAVLASSPGHVVPISRIIDGIWGDDPPRTAEQSVYTYVAALRNALEPSRGRRERSKVLIGAAGGYRLHVSQVDAVAFAEWLDRARRAVARGDHADALPDLDEALALWRGEPLTGVPGPFAESERARLGEVRIAAHECRAEALLGLDRPQDTLTPLRALVLRHPLRERPRELLMQALLRCGRRAEALVVYEESRRVLREELGVEPGEGLRRSHRSALDSGDRSGPGRSPLPRQLPRDLDGFVGRTREIIRLKGLLAPWDDAEPSPLVVISGPPGVGKSALAVRIANLVKDRYPDGQLYVNLRGATVGLPGLGPLEVLGRFLRALGADGGAIPGDVDEAAALWRSTLAGRRTLILLDDAAGLGQILPLLPAPRGTAIVVTSRETLAAGDDCVQLHLPRLSLSESVTVLAKLAGAERMAAHPEETAGLVGLCDGLPLALRIAGARLADRPNWSVAALTGRLRDERRRLHELAAGELAVRASLAASWSALTGSARPVDRTAARTLGLLGLLHLHDVTAEVAAALLGATTDEAERALERLVDAHLLEPLADPGRYQLHDLVRLFAAEMAPGDATAPLARALSYCIASARLAVITMDPHRVQAEGPEVAAVPRPVRGRDEAIAWLAREGANLVAAAGQAMASPDAELAGLGVALCFSLFWYQQYAHEPVPLIGLNRQALEVCERLGDRLGVYHAHGHLAYGLSLQGSAESGAHLEAQLVLARELGDRFSEQRTLGNLANLAVEWGRPRQALGYAGRQLALARRIGAEVGVRYALMMTGRAWQKLGRPAEARRHLYTALAAAERIGDTGQEMSMRLILGEVCLDEGDPAAAADHLGRALAASRSHGNRLGELQCLVHLSRAHRDLGDAHAALPYVAEAVSLAGELRNAKWRGVAENEQRMVHELVGVPAVRV